MDKQQQAQMEIEEDIRRVKLPRNTESLGIIAQRLGGSRMRVKCFDGKTRICRIPGRLKRKLWVREEDVVLVEPWEYDKDKGDIIFKYKKNQVDWLKRNGYLKSAEDLQEF